MSASSGPSRALSPEEDLLHDHLAELFGQVRSENHLGQKIHHLRRMIHHTFRFPALTMPSPNRGSNDLESNLLQLLERGIDSIVEGFQDLLEQPWRNIHTLDLWELKRTGPALSRAADEQVEQCLEDFSRYKLYWSHSQDHLAVAKMLAAISEVAEGLERRAKWPRRRQREWLVDFVLFFFVQVARVTSSRFGLWEVRMLNQSVRGTGVGAAVERPTPKSAMGEVSEQSINAESQAETQIREQSDVSEGRMGRASSWMRSWMCGIA